MNIFARYGSLQGSARQEFCLGTCHVVSNSFLFKVDKSYIEDGFNLYGLRNQVPHFLESMEIILDRLGA